MIQMRNIKETYPAVALRGTTVLPGMIVHFDISREKSKKAVEAAMMKDQKLFLITQRDPELEEPQVEDLYRIGTIAFIKQVMKLPHDMIRLLVEGLERAELLELGQTTPFLECETAVFEEEKELEEAVQEAMRRSLKKLFQEYALGNNKIGKDLVRQILDTEDLQNLMEQFSINLPLSWKRRQLLLEAVSAEDLYEALGVILTNEIQVQQITKELRKKVQDSIDKNQKEYILREQMKVIRQELGEDAESDADKYEMQVEELEASEEVKKKLRKEISRFRMINSNAAESPVMRTYIETLLSIPWEKHSEDCNDLKRAFQILEEDHYGLDEVKERIMEFLAVRKLTQKGKSPILCLVGPPGTGKTSIAQSMAKALNKKYVRICLGGVRDEAEIRGHRKTYVGAMPGRITTALIQAKVNNPLMLLDEIDKTSSDHKGDTASALLEVLDPEQNSRFNDHYTEIPQDLSEVLFIATANDKAGIPRPLLDRMEILDISGYTENEKEHIAALHLIPKQLEANGLKPEQLTIRPAAVRKIITSYTREAGVRSLERKIGQICRKTAREILENGKKKVVVTPANLSKFLGQERRTILMANEKDEIGIARGLAWTSVGGDTLQIEVNVMPGKGELKLTGQMGDVMKESALTGISYIRSVVESFNSEIKPEYFTTHDIHLHIPEGAVPKDGPSAGITMATAMLSAIIECPVKASVAMTGEITLRGRVLAIGGLKEKLLSAKAAGIKMVLVPAENKADVKEMSSEITSGLEIHFVERMEEVLSYALAEKKEEQK